MRIGATNNQTECEDITQCNESSQKCTSLKQNCDTNCSTRKVIYLISCKKCNKQYVGQTSQQVSKRMNSHKFDVSNFKKTFAEVLGGLTNPQSIQNQVNQLVQTEK